MAHPDCLHAECLFVNMSTSGGIGAANPGGIASASSNADAGGYAPSVALELQRELALLRSENQLLKTRLADAERALAQSAQSPAISTRHAPAGHVSSSAAYKPGDWSLFELVGHKDGVWDVSACRWHSRLIASASADGQMFLWDAVARSAVGTCTPHRGSANSIRFHPSLPFFCSASGDRSVRVYSIPAGVHAAAGHHDHSTASAGPVVLTPVPTTHHAAGTSPSLTVSALNSPPSSSACDAVGNPVPFHRARSRSNSGPAIPPPSIGGPASTAAGAQGVNTGSDMPVVSSGMVPSSPIISGRPTVHGSTANVAASVASAGVSTPGAAAVVHPCPVVIDIKRFPAPVLSAEWLASGDAIAAAGWDPAIRLFSVDGGGARELQTLQGHTKMVSNITAHATQPAMLISASKDDTFRIWDSRAGRCTHTVDEHSKAVNSAMFAPTPSGGGDVIVSSGNDEHVFIWDHRNLRSPTVSVSCHSSVNRFSFSPSGSRFAAPADDGVTKVFGLHGELLGDLDSRPVMDAGASPTVGPVPGARPHRMSCAAAWSHDESVVFAGGWHVALYGWARAKA